MQNNDWVPALASGLFIGVKKGVLAFTTEQLRVVLAIAVLTLPLVNVLIQKKNYDWVRLLLLAKPCITRVWCTNILSLARRPCQHSSPHSCPETAALLNCEQACLCTRLDVQG